MSEELADKPVRFIGEAQLLRLLNALLLVPLGCSNESSRSLCGAQSGEIRVTTLLGAGLRDGCAQSAPDHEPEAAGLVRGAGIARARTRALANVVGRALERMGRSLEDAADDPSLALCWDLVVGGAVLADLDRL